MLTQKNIYGNKRKWMFVCIIANSKQLFVIKSNCILPSSKVFVEKKDVGIWTIAGQINKVAVFDNLKMPPCLSLSWKTVCRKLQNNTDKMWLRKIGRERKAKTANDVWR